MTVKFRKQLILRMFTMAEIVIFLLEEAMRLILTVIAIFYKAHLQKKAERGTLTKEEWKVYNGPFFF